jgi:hypothetical protein
MAKELAIIPNTVARAYRQLQDERVLAAIRGTAVEGGSRRGCQADRKRLIRERLRDCSRIRVSVSRRNPNPRTFRRGTENRQMAARKIVNPSNETGMNPRRPHIHIASQLADACATSFLVANEFENYCILSYSLIEWTDFVVRQRALLVQLALLAYEIDHGVYPETLDALVPDYMPKLIHDPYSGEPFEYRPEGFDLPLVNGGVDDRSYRVVPPGTPLFWSVDLGNCRLQDFIELVRDPDEITRMANIAGGDGGEMVDEGPARSEEEHTRTTLRFHPTERFDRSRYEFIFPLPKIKSAEE